MKKSIYFLLIAIATLTFTGCSDDNDGSSEPDITSSAPADINCDDAKVRVCNYSQDSAVYYSWNSNQITDTIWPGECHTRSFGPISITYDQFGNEASASIYYTTFNTSGAGYQIRVDECLKIIAAPGGYRDISHCSNGIFDPNQGEFDTDCGGSCPPCGAINIPCNSSLVSDQITWTTRSNVSVNSTSEYVTGSKMNIFVRGYSGEELDIKLPITRLPDRTQVFLTGSNFQDAEMRYFDRSLYYNVNAGQRLYLEPLGNGKALIKFCGMQFSNLTGSASIEFDD